MAQRQCQKCGETVDEAKAFCPSCGEALVEENIRGEASVFESMDRTMQLGNTMYNQMLSDMGLNISAKPASPRDAAVPSITSAKPAIPAPSVTLQPLASPAVPAASGGIRKWVIVAFIALALFFLLLLALFAAGYLLYRSQGG